MKLEFSQQIFEKHSISDFMKILPRGPELFHADRRVDMTKLTVTLVDRDSSVDIATRYGLDGPGIGSRGGGLFRTRPVRPWGPSSLLYTGYRIFPVGKAAGASH